MRMNKRIKSLVFIAAAVVLVNMFVSFLPWKLDLTAGRTYSLSRSSRDILSGLESQVKVTLYISRNFPARLSPLKKDVFDLMEEYKAYGRDRLTEKLIHLEQNTREEADALSKGISRLQFSEVENDQFSVKVGYFGAVVSSGDRQEVLPSLLDPATLEYELTTAIHRVSRKETPKIGILTKETADTLGLFREFMGKQFEIRDVNFENMDSFVLDAVIYKDDRQTGLTEEERGRLEKAAVTGQTLLLFLDGVWVDRVLQVVPARHNLRPLLEKYGLALERNLVLSNSAETASFNTGETNFVAKYPLWLKLGGNSVNKRLSFGMSGTTVTLPWSSSVSLSGGRTESLITSPPDSWVQRGDFSLFPGQIPLGSGRRDGGFTLAASAKAGQGTILLVGNSRFPEDAFNSVDTGNIQLIGKLLDYYANQGLLSSITFRNIRYAPIKEVTNARKVMIRYLNMLVPVSLFIGYGLLRHLRRDRRAGLKADL